MKIKKKLCQKKEETNAWTVMGAGSVISAIIQPTEAPEPFSVGGCHAQRDLWM
jgi:hypothetical protein